MLLECYIFAIGRLTLFNSHLYAVYIGKNVGTEYMNESMGDWHSDTLFQVMCYWNSIDVTVQTFKLSDLQNLLTFKTFWPSKPSDLHVDALSQHALSYTMLLLTPDINLIIITQICSNHNTIYLLYYILYAYYIPLPAKYM